VGSALTALAPTSAESADALPHLWSSLKGIPTDRFMAAVHFRSRRPPAARSHPADGGGLIWLGLGCPLTGSHTSRLRKLCLQHCQEAGFDLIQAFAAVNPRTAIALVEIAYDGDNADEKQRATRLHESLAENASAAGFHPYRAAISQYGRILASNPEFARLADKLKAALDPAGIVAPGRYGVGLPP
jgi:4-cresol dehydrogenase (hydroxylating)